MKSTFFFSWAGWCARELKIIARRFAHTDRRIWKKKKILRKKRTFRRLFLGNMLAIFFSYIFSRSFHMHQSILYECKPSLIFFLLSYSAQRTAEHVIIFLSINMFLLQLLLYSQNGTERVDIKKISLRYIYTFVLNITSSQLSLIFFSAGAVILEILLTTESVLFFILTIHSFDIGSQDIKGIYLCNIHEMWYGKLSHISVYLMILVKLECIKAKKKNMEAKRVTVHTYF